jgi:predicted DNA-binding protein
MRSTKVYSITMSLEMAKQAERLAKRENRTMSELMREALRRYQQSPLDLDVREYVRRIAPAPPTLRAIRQEAKRNDTAKLTMQQIDREVAAVRRQGRKKSKQPAR